MSRRSRILRIYFPRALTISITMKLNLLIAWPFFPIRKYIQAATALPNSRASHRMRSNDTGKVSKIQSAPCFNSFLPPNRCCRPGEEAHRARLSRH